MKHNLLCYTSGTKERKKSKINECLGWGLIRELEIEERKALGKKWKNNLNVRKDACGRHTILWLSSNCNLSRTEVWPLLSDCLRGCPQPPTPMPSDIIVVRDAFWERRQNWKVKKVLIGYSWYDIFLEFIYF